MIINFRHKTLRRIISYIFCLALIVVVFRISNYPGNEGFNPSDDGVVLAQSYRIIHGEVPHRDFISIRPVFSGVLHSLHFISPLPLFDSARWFVIFQFIVIAFSAASVLPRLLQASYSVAGEIAVFFILFTLSILNYNLFPWTTIDAVFWSALSLWFLYSVKNFDSKAFLGVFMLVLAALSRQTFVLPALVLSMFFLIQYFWKFRLPRGIFVVALAWLPAVLYAAMLVVTGAGAEFITQMTGRTEFVETGLIQYAVRWVKSPAVAVHAIMLLMFLASLFIRNRKNPMIAFLIRRSGLLTSLMLFWVTAIIAIHFLRSDFQIYLLPFELFFVLIDLIMLAWIVKKPDYPTLGFAFFTLLIAYTSSITLGDNSPIFACGLLMAGVLSISRWLMAATLVRLPTVRLASAFLLTSALVIIVLGFYSQRKINYRDLPANDLHYQLSTVNPQFGSVMTNSRTGAYYADLHKIYTSLPGAANHTMVLPHNAAFYPLLQTRNPLPLDWMQPAEYCGSEKRVMQSLTDVCSRSGYYFIVDKYDVKKIHTSEIPLQQSDFAYLQLIIGTCNKIETQSHFFDVYATQ